MDAWLMYLFPLLVLVLLVFEGRRRLSRRAGEGDARGLTLHGLWEMWQGLIAVGCIAFLFYQLGIDAIEDPNTRAVLFATIAAIAVVGGLGLLWRRYRARRAG